MAGLDYTVEKKEILLPNGTVIPEQFATVKAGTDHVFGIVGNQYEIVQNADAFEFIDEIVPEGLQFVKADETKDFIYIIASLPERYVLGDKFTPYVIFQNSHNGYSTLRAAICPLRMVCQNQFTIAFKNADTKISLRHSSSIYSKLETAKAVLQQSAAYMDTFEQEANLLANLKVDAPTQLKVLDEYFKVPENASARTENTINERREIFVKALDANDNQNFKGTAWGMVNAFADYITHTQPKRNTETSAVNKFTSVTFDPKLMQKFTNILKVNAM